LKSSKVTQQKGEKQAVTTRDAIMRNSIASNSNNKAIFKQNIKDKKSPTVTLRGSQPKSDITPTMSTKSIGDVNNLED
jgi:hypothetical protein